MHTWQRERVAFDPLVQLPKIGNESHFTILLGSDEGWMTPLGVVNFLEHAGFDQTVAFFACLFGARHWWCVHPSVPRLGTFL